MQSLLNHIGRTPLVRLAHIGRDLPVPVLVAALRVAARGGLVGPVITVMCDSWDRYRAKPWMQGW